MLVKLPAKRFEDTHGQTNRKAGTPLAVLYRCCLQLKGLGPAGPQLEKTYTRSNQRTTMKTCHGLKLT